MRIIILYLYTNSYTSRVYSQPNDNREKHQQARFKLSIFTDNIQGDKGQFTSASDSVFERADALALTGPVEGLS